MVRNCRHQRLRNALLSHMSPSQRGSGRLVVSAATYSASLEEAKNSAECSFYYWTAILGSSAIFAKIFFDAFC